MTRREFLLVGAGGASLVAVTAPYLRRSPRVYRPLAGSLSAICARDRCAAFCLDRGIQVWRLEDDGRVATTGPLRAIEEDAHNVLFEPELALTPVIAATRKRIYCWLGDSAMPRWTAESPGADPIGLSADGDHLYVAEGHYGSRRTPTILERRIDSGEIRRTVPIPGPKGWGLREIEMTADRRALAVRMVTSKLVRWRTFPLNQDGAFTESMGDSPAELRVWLDTDGRLGAWRDGKRIAPHQEASLRGGRVDRVMVESRRGWAAAFGEGIVLYRFDLDTERGGRLRLGA